MITNTPSSGFAVFLYRLTLFGVIALPFTAAGIWLFWDMLAPLVASNVPRSVDVLSVSIWGRLGGFALSLIGALVQAYGLLGLAQTFQEGAHGRALSQKSVAGFRRFAWVTLLMVPLRVALSTATVTILSMTDTVPGGSVSLHLGSQEVSALFLALALVFAAQVFAQGHKADAENQAFL